MTRKMKMMVITILTRRRARTLEIFGPIPPGDMIPSNPLDPNDEYLVPTNPHQLVEDLDCHPTRDRKGYHAGKSTYCLWPKRGS